MKCLAFKENGNAPKQWGETITGELSNPWVPSGVLLIPCSIHGCSQSYSRELPSGDTAVNEDFRVLFACITKIMHCTEVLTLSLWALKVSVWKTSQKCLKMYSKIEKGDNNLARRRRLAQALFTLARMAFSLAAICFYLLLPAYFTCHGPGAE